MKNEMTIAEIKAELKSQGLNISKCNATMNGQPIYRVWDDTRESEQFAKKYTKGGIIENFIR